MFAVGLQKNISAGLQKILQQRFDGGLFFYKGPPVGYLIRQANSGPTGLKTLESHCPEVIK